MESGNKLWEYIEGWCLLRKCSHLDHKRLENVVRSCHHVTEMGAQTQPKMALQASCPVCEQIMVYELTEQVSAIKACLASCSQRLLRPDLASGLQRYLWGPMHFFADNHSNRMIQETRSLIMYVAMSAIAIDKVLEKYCNKVNIGRGKLQSKLQAKRIELLKLPWLMELCAFQINSHSHCIYTSTEDGDALFTQIWPGWASCIFTACTNIGPVIDTVFDPVALECGHIFCNSCACASASVPTFAGLKTASHCAKCPLCAKTIGRKDCERKGKRGSSKLRNIGIINHFNLTTAWEASLSGLESP
eukprot:Gb_40171 [translate_table: standard]